MIKVKSLFLVTSFGYLTGLFFFLINFNVAYLFFKFSKNATLLFSMPGTSIGLEGRSGLL